LLDDKDIFMQGGNGFSIVARLNVGYTAELGKKVREIVGEEYDFRGEKIKIDLMSPLSSILLDSILD